MNNILSDIGRFIKSLSINDIIFFGSVIALLVLIAVIVYLLKLSKLEKEEMIQKLSLNEIISDEKLLGLESEEEDNEDILPPAEDEPENLIDLETLTKALEEQDYSYIDVDKYEKEEEEKAIISYEELLKNKSAVKINYKDEIDDDGVMIKEIDLDNLTSKVDQIVEAPVKVQLVSYQKEEAFLKALKDLQSLLN